jgi:hypothetical protein
MEAIRMHSTGGRARGRVVAMAAIGLLLCAIALGLALLGVQALTIGGADMALDTLDVHTPSPKAGPATTTFFGADGASQPFSGPDEITEQARSRA